MVISDVTPATRKCWVKGVDQLAEPALRGYAERHAGEAVEHHTARADLCELLKRLIEEAVGNELDR